MTKTLIRLAAAAALVAVGIAGAAIAAEEGEHGPVHYPLIKPERQEWTFAGPLGTFDRAQLQRGYLVYSTVCSACHSMEYLRYRNLTEEGGPEFTEAQVKALLVDAPAIMDGPGDDGEMFERPRELKDPFPSPFANEKAARAANNGAYPPDLSLIAKARAVERGFPWFVLDIFTTYQEQGPDYIYNLLVGYTDPPEGVTVPDGQYYNPHFIAGPALAMSPPLSDDAVTYTDGTPTTLQQHAKDVTAFLAWAAEPHLESRKQTGFRAIIFLIVFAGLLYYTKRKIWSDVAH